MLFAVTSRPSPDNLCQNCGTPELGEYCVSCGQKNSDLHAPIGALVGEFIEESLGFDSRLRHTLVPFLFKPGFITRDYNAGRRVRYTSPLKLYLVASVIFFLALSWNGNPLVVHVDDKDA